MKQNAIIWVVGLTVFVALGLVAIVAYDMMNTAIESYFFT